MKTESHIVELTGAALTHGNLNIRICGLDFFPKGILGGATDEEPGTLITIKAEGLEEVIRTDIPTYRNTGQPRWIFRRRGWIKRFVRMHKLKQGDGVTISRVGRTTYELKPRNGECADSKVSGKSEQSYVPGKGERKRLKIPYERSCDCSGNHINCLDAKEWLKCQLGVWQFNYEGRDVRDKKLHPATFPIGLAKKVIKLFSHKGELVIDPFVGSGTTLVAAQDTGRNAVGFDLQREYVKLSKKRLAENSQLFEGGKQIAVCDNALHIAEYLAPETVTLLFTSPPYANLLNRKRKNKSRRHRKNEQLGKIEQYSQDPRDLGTMTLDKYTAAMGDIFESIFPLLRPKAHCVINVPDMWWENKRITIHVSLIEELRHRGYELRNVIIWDRTNIVNQIGIFGWPSNYITMGVTFEYLLDFWRPPR